MKKTTVLLILILLFSAIIRLYRLGEIPEGFHSDEAAFGYNAYSLLKTGKDEYGNTFPLILKSFGDYKGAIYAYLSIPFVAFWGLNEFSSRVVSAIIGTLLVFVVYKFVYEVFKNKKIAIATSIVFSISPVSLFLSRVQSDPLIANFFLYAGMTLFLSGVKNIKFLYLLLSLAAFILAIFSHQASATLLILLLSVLIYWIFNKINRKYKVFSLLLFVIALLFSVSSMKSSINRYNEVNFMKNPSVTIPLTAGIYEEGIMKAPMFVTRIFHNKFIQSYKYLVEAMGKYWSVQFLFLEAGQPIREIVPDIGIFYLMELPLILYGIYIGLREFRSQTVMLLSWVFLGTVAISMAVDETPNIHRFYYLALPFYVFIAIALLNIVKRKGHLGIFYFNLKYPLIVIYIISFTVYTHQLFIHQPVHKPYFRDFAYKELVYNLEDIKNNYDSIVFTKSQSSPYIHILFHTKYDPVKYHNSGSKRDLNYERLDNYYFVPDECPLNEIKYDDFKKISGQKNLFINRGGCKITPNTRIISIVRWRDGLEAFQLVEYQATPAGLLKL